MQAQRQGLVQDQRLKMNPQLLQSIQLMALPIQELQARIEAELEANPALELVEEKPTLSIDELRPGATEDESREYFENSSDPGFSSGYDDAAGDAKRSFMEGALSRPESLQEHLEWQWRLHPVSPELFRVGILVIHNLDNNGFHQTAPQELVPESQRDTLMQALNLVQGLDPIGCAVADYRESLLVQAQRAENCPDYVCQIIAEHLPLLEKSKPNEIARKLKADPAAIDIAIAFIRGLNPFPGRLYAGDQPTYVIPDLMVVMREGRIVLLMNDEEIPVLGVNGFFESLAHGADGEKTARRFASRSVKDAKWFIHSIEQRKNTLMKTARSIVEFQRNFFLKGPKFLVPLTLKDIAGEVGVHEATVSRITTNKYVQTEWGIFELKYFFSNAVSGTVNGGTQMSKEAVKETIREILAEEGLEQHLSDQKIAELLAKRGITIARRTVAKYRNELAISSSYDR